MKLRSIIENQVFFLLVCNKKCKHTKVSHTLLITCTHFLAARLSSDLYQVKSLITIK